MTDYLRAKIEFCFTTVSPLHVGNGEIQKMSNRARAQQARHFGVNENQVERTEAEKDATYACVYRAAEKPYIPGSTVRGLLRRLLNSEAIFGSHRGADNLLTGNLIVEDAHFVSGPSQTSHLSFFDADRCSYIAHHIAIDPVTGAVAKGKLYSLELLPAGVKFKCVLHLEAHAFKGTDKTLGKLITDTEIASLVQVLQKLDGTSDTSALGAGTGLGLGRIECVSATRFVLPKTGKTGFAQWLRTHEPPANLAYSAPPLTSLGMVSPSKLKAPSAANSFELIMEFLSPLLCSDPARKKPKITDQTAEAKPMLAFLRDSAGQPIIPARTLRGLLRARCRKILLSMVWPKALDHEARVIRADALVNELFGSEQKRSLINLTEARVPTPSATAAKPYQQTFNAMDRFTGGVAAGKLYSVERADNPVLHTQFSTRSDLVDWQKGLLALCARDAMEGDLALGWGKAKGFGRFRLQVAAFPSFAFGSGLPEANKAQLISWVAALEARITQSAQSAEPSIPEQTHG